MLKAAERTFCSVLQRAAVVVVAGVVMLVLTHDALGCVRMLLQVLHTFVKEMSGHALDFTAPVAKLLHTLT
jgi:hypothetical protein